MIKKYHSFTYKLLGERGYNASAVGNCFDFIKLIDLNFIFAF